MTIAAEAEDVTLNEYVHEDYIEEMTDRGVFVVRYEPVEYTTLGNLMANVFVGTKNGGRKHLYSFIGSRGLIRPVHMSLNHLQGGVFDPHTGVIKLFWDRYPGEHVLCVSYEWGERVAAQLMEEAATPRIDWRQEGF